MLRTLILAHNWAIISSFISRVIAFFLSPEARNTDEHFVEMMGYENKTISKKKMLVTQHTVDYRAPAVRPGDHRPDGAAARCHRSASRETIVLHATTLGRDQN